MKKDWELKKLGEVCSIVKDKPPEFKGEKPYYSTGNVDNENNFKQFECVRFEERPSRANSYPKLFDVSFAKMKFTNKVFDVNENLVGSIFSTGFCFLRPNHKIDCKYLKYFLLSEIFQSKKDFYSGDGIMGGIKNSDVEQVEIPLTSLVEQKRIVAILDEAFGTLATAKENAEKNLQNARKLFDSYLQSIFANLGEGWEKKTLNQISTSFGRGRSKNRPRNDKHLYGGKYPFIQTGDVSNSDHRITTYSQTYNEVGLAQSKMWPRGTICIAIVGANVAETAILDFDACFPDSVIGAVVDNQITSNEYVEYLLQSFNVDCQR